jgi:hypothetical protein
MDETMRVLTINELLRLTRTAVYGLLTGITAELAIYPERSPERTDAQINLSNIRGRPMLATALLSVVDIDPRGAPGCDPDPPPGTDMLSVEALSVANST